MEALVPGMKDTSHTEAVAAHTEAATAHTEDVAAHTEDSANLIEDVMSHTAPTQHVQRL